MTSITLDSVTKRFGTTPAVSSVDLTIRPGELFFILGPSGCGKTTLLRMIAGFTEPDAGRISFGDKDVTSLAPNKRNTGMVFQSYALWPHMTVQANVAYGLRMRGVSGSDRRDRALAALRAAQMEDLAERKPAELSGGQQQRVALARALVVEPQVLLLDEPLSNLDPALRHQMRKEIKRLCKQSGITTVYVTHDQKEALSMADTVAVLREGRVEQVGAPRDLYTRPNCRFVAGFLGETNFLAGTIVSADNGVVSLDTPAGKLRSTAGCAAATPGTSVTCSIRPEAVRVVAKRAASEVNSLSGRHIETVYLGETVQHHFELDDGTRWQVLELEPSKLPRAKSVNLTISSDEVVLLRD